jgi:branched-chain amino acid transport system substrate-binding protein
MPQIIEVMENGTVSFTDDYREARFELYMEQLFWNETADALRPLIIWPDHLKEGDFVLPDWFEAAAV